MPGPRYRAWGPWKVVAEAGAGSRCRGGQSPECQGWSVRKPSRRGGLPRAPRAVARTGRETGPRSRPAAPAPGPAQEPAGRVHGAEGEGEGPRFDPLRAVAVGRSAPRSDRTCSLTEETLSRIFVSARAFASLPLLPGTASPLLPGPSLATHRSGLSSPEPSLTARRLCLPHFMKCFCQPG